MSTHRLAAIMFADIVGYTALMQQNEASGIARATRLREAVETLVPRHGGELFEMRGDGALCLFPSATEAVRCAIRIQETVRDEVPLRIGLHQGDIVQKEGHLFGDAVNVASRIESMGIAGGVLISSSIRQQIKNKPEFKLISLGKIEFKNVTEPMEVYAIRNEGLQVPKPEEMQGKGKQVSPQKEPGTYNWRRTTSLVFAAMLLGIILLRFWEAPDSKDVLTEEIRESRIAILPFENKTGDPNLDILGDMAADWVVQGLMELEDLKIVSFENVLTNRNLISEDGEQKNFAAQTGAEKLIRGRYYKSGNDLIFQSRVIDASNGEILVALPEIKGPSHNHTELVTQLQQRTMTIFAAEDNDFSPGVSQNPPSYEAYRLYLEGTMRYGQDFPGAISFFSQAIEADSQFLIPYIFLAGAYYTIGNYAQSDSMLQSIRLRFGINQLGRREKLWYEYSDNAIHGNFEQSLEAVYQLHQIDPRQYIPALLCSNLASMINRPYTMVEVSSHIDPERHRDFYPHASWLKQYSFNLCRLEKYDQSLEILKLVLPKFRDREYYDRKADIFISQNHQDSLESLVHSMEKAQMNPSEILYEFIYIAERYGVRKMVNHQREWANKGIAWMNNQMEQVSFNAYNRGCVHYFAGNYEQAKRIFLSIHSSSIENRRNFFSRLGCIYARLGQKEKAVEMAKELQILYERTSSGWVLAFQAHIFSQLGEIQHAVDLFLQAKEAGISYLPGTHDHDIMLVPLFDHPQFKEAVSPHDRDQEREGRINS